MADLGIDSWTEELSARERVSKIATTLTQPRPVQWIDEQAGIGSCQTTTEYLEMLAEFEVVHAIEGDDGNTTYAPNYQRRYLTEVIELINEHTREELREEIAAIQEQIDRWRTEFDVESRCELESTLVNEDLDSERIRERNTIIRRWEGYEDTKRMLHHALELYDDARSLHFDQNDPPDVSESS